MAEMTLNWECERWHVKTTEYPCDKRREAKPKECEDCSGAVELNAPSQVETTKECPKCKQVLPIEGFYKNKARHDALSRTCKTCTDEYGAKTKAKNREQNLSGQKPGVRICRKCKRELSLEDFPLEPARKDGRGYVCKECKNQGWKKDNPANTKGRYEAKKSNKKTMTQTDKIKGLVEKLEIEETRLEEKEKQLKATQIKIDRQILDTISEIDGVTQALGTIFMLDQLIEDSEKSPKISLGKIAMQIFETYRE